STVPTACGSQNAALAATAPSAYRPASSGESSARATMRSTEVSAIITSCTCPAAITVRTPGWWLAAERCSSSDPNDDDGAGAHVGGAARAVQASAPTQTAATPTAPAVSAAPTPPPAASTATAGTTFPHPASAR